MADRTIKFRRLKQILARHGVAWNKRRGKGSHGIFSKTIGGVHLSYPVPDDTDVLVCYVRGCRKKFRLTEADGVTDAEFYE